MYVGMHVTSSVYVPEMDERYSLSGNQCLHIEQLCLKRPLSDVSARTIARRRVSELSTIWLKSPCYQLATATKNHPRFIDNPIAKHRLSKTDTMNTTTITLVLRPKRPTQNAPVASTTQLEETDVHRQHPPTPLVPLAVPGAETPALSNHQNKYRRTTDGKWHVPAYRAHLI